MSSAEQGIEDALAASDPSLARVVKAVIERIGRQRITPARTTPFEALVRATIYQSISEKAATAIYDRLRQAVGTPFSPATVLGMPADAIAAAGVSKPKLRTILNLTEWFVTNPSSVKALSSQSDDDIVRTLTGIAGVGAWTANVFLIFGLGRLDVMPASDSGIRRGVQLVYGLKDPATPKQVYEKAERWRPYRSIASIYLWNAVKLHVPVMPPGEPPLMPPPKKDG